MSTQLPEGIPPVPKGYKFVGDAGVIRKGYMSILKVFPGDAWSKGKFDLSGCATDPKDGCWYANPLTPAEALIAATENLIEDARVMWHLVPGGRFRLRDVADNIHEAQVALEAFKRDMEEKRKQQEEQ